MKRNEYPRPQFMREQWLNLNGEWEFDFDDRNQGETDKWYTKNHSLSRKINVPFAFQSELSGIGETGFHDIVWYKRDIQIPKEWQGKSIILHFGAVDFHTKVYVNEMFIGEHIGGNTSFSFDITNHLSWGETEYLTVRVEDPSTDETIPRGKQYWKEDPQAIWYTRTTGIWQTVWLEPVADNYIKQVKMTPLLDSGEIAMEFDLSNGCIDKQLQVDISYQGQNIVNDIIVVKEDMLKRKFYLFHNEIDRSEFHGTGWTWKPETPNLFDVSFTLSDKQKQLDAVQSYFGMRKVHAENGMVYLNNRPYYQKLVLDQGYWPSGLLTAPTDEDYINDILKAKELGFNGCRKHQKVEDPRFLYWADKLGFIVWGECASPSVYSNKTVEYVTKEWLEIVERDYNHPSIIVWTPINESWGVPEISVNRTQQHFSQAIYHLIHSLDPTRLVISNDGWEMTETDICGIHSYVHGNKEEVEKYQHFAASLSTKEDILASEPNRRRIYCNSFTHQGEPIMLTEFGGIGFSKGNSKGWGYTSAKDETEFLEDYQRVIQAIYQSNAIMGFCYTQFTDVEQEQNGLLTYDRQYKCDPEKVKMINDQWHPDTIDKRQFSASE
ncbi:glycoside hydrolase family 2 protein [Gracilibacillus alcaliphilus]|uniref:glycoside hydrolase family 2 protein n=1 Tax=Gracilibacillus alcaliphilus TaxID=1401441 RepID=UPI00195D0084|nr:sugar-binding domain-containing protein [Gracilibacillus alcaliphilus]MBM7677685.1 beta-galactosidase/beta-glucuronidase [Gracilibacillus alcaliphilus]